MSNVTRRNFLKVAGATSLAAGMALLPKFATSTGYAQSDALMGKIVITRTGPVSIHTYVAPEAVTRVTSHIIETDSQLVMVDAQMLGVHALELKSYVESLGKPLNRIYLSHEHPDHWAAAENFDAPLLSTAGVVSNVTQYIETIGMTQLASFFPEELLPQTLRTPEAGVESGSETIDGLTLEFDIVLDAEVAEQVAIRIPEAGIVILQDLLFSGTHMYPLGNREGWIQALNELRTLREEGYDTLLAGHGVPTTFGEIDTVIDYLTTTDEIIAASDSPEEAIVSLRERYPSHDATGILDIFIPFRFQQ